jgi:hypothetical protein
MVLVSAAFSYCSRESSATACRNSRRARKVSERPRSPMRAFTASTQPAKHRARPTQTCSRRFDGSFGSVPESGAAGLSGNFVIVE